MLFNETEKVKLGYLGTVEGKSMYENARTNPEQIVALFKEMKADETKRFDTSREFFKAKVNKESYYFFEKWNGVDVFKELPLVERTELFNWIRRDWGSVSSYWCQINRGFLRFNCKYNLDTKDTRINIFWENKSYDSIASIYIKNSTNEDILESIENWLADFGAKVDYTLKENNTAKEFMAAKEYIA